jgi:large subunit ribosomal protein L4
MKLQYITAEKQTTKEFSSKVLDMKPNQQVLAKYVRVILSNRREGNAQTKDRSEVSGGGRKPWRQKGTGRARHGSSRSPIWKGGGITFGPTNAVNHKLQINKKEKVLAFATALYNHVAEKTTAVAELPTAETTKEAQKFLVDAKLPNRLLIVTDNASLYRSLRNLRGVKIKSTADFSAFDLASANYVVFGAEEFGKVLTQKENILGA